MRIEESIIIDRSPEEVSEYEPGRRIAHRTVEGPVQLNTTCITEPVGGGTRVTVVAETERFVDGALGRVANPLVARLVRRSFKADLAKLKKILHSEAQGVG